jgi:hypothetical protein
MICELLTGSYCLIIAFWLLTVGAVFPLPAEFLLCYIGIFSDIQPDSVCKKLGPKYAYIPDAELKDHPDFYEDLLRCAMPIDHLCVFTNSVIKSKFNNITHNGIMMLPCHIS